MRSHVISIFILSLGFVVRSQVTAQTKVAELTPSLLKVGGNTNSGFEKMSCERMIKVAVGNASQTGADFLASNEVKGGDCEKSIRDRIVESDSYKKCKENKERLKRQLEYDKANLVNALIVRIAIYDTKYLYNSPEGRMLFPYTGCTPALVSKTFSKLWEGNRGGFKTDAQLVNIPELLNYCQISEIIGGSESHETKLARLYKNSKAEAAYKDRVICQQVIDAWKKSEGVVYAPGVKRNASEAPVASVKREVKQCDSKGVDCSALTKSAIAGVASNPCFNEVIIDCMVNGGGEGTRFASEEPAGAETQRPRVAPTNGAGKK